MEEFLLIKAAEKGDLEKVRKLLKEGRDVNKEDQFGNTALMRAARYGHFEIASLLIEYGARINRQNQGGYSALYFASTNSIISLLMEKGADINIKTIYGETALMRSASWGYYSIVSFLLKSGVDASLLNNYGKTALYYARVNDNFDCVAILENYEHFHRYRKVWLSFATSLRSYQEDQNQESKQNQIQSQSQIRSPSLMRMMDSSDLVRYVTEFM